VSAKPPVGSELSRDLSLFHVTMMGMGMMIGAGVFLGMGRSIGYVGPGGVMLTFALNGLVALFTAMSYAELSSAIPRAGGAYNFARVGFGRGTSFVAGWMEWFASSVAGALYAVCFATYFVRFLNGMGLVSLGPDAARIAVRAVAATIALAFIYINYRGASETGKIGAVITLLQTLFLAAIGVVGVIVVVKDPSRLANFDPFMNPEHGMAGLLVTMGFTAVAFEGYEVIAQAGDEVIDPRRNIPKAMLYSVLVVTVTYVLCAFAAVVGVKAGPELTVNGSVAAPWVWIGSFGGEGFGASVERLLPRVGGLLVVLAVVFASTSALNATLYSATRAAYALGRDGMLPGVFARISSRRRTPWVALLFTSIIVLVVATGLDADQVAASASIMFLFLFFLVNVCVIRIRYNMGDELEYGFLMPLFPVLPILAIVCQAVLAVFLHEIGPTAWIIAPAWIAAGAVLYYTYSRRRASPSAEEIHVLEETPRPEGGGYRIMVAVANPDNALAMVRQTYVLCGAKDASVELLHMVPVPDVVPLSDAEHYMREGKEAIVETLLYLAPHFPLSTTIRYCRNAARGIVSAVREKRTDLLIMGWHGRRRSERFVLGSTVDPVIERVPCNVAILKNCGDRRFLHALVPVSGGPNSALALEMASILVDAGQGRVTAFSVRTGARRPGVDAGEVVESNLERLSLAQDRLRAKTIFGPDIVQAILKEAANPEEDYDAVVIGATEAPLAYQFMRESIPEQVARLCEKPLVMVKASGGLRSWVRRWI
jgi:amino acid transporter/nucleotide-binding universal stress UspA family protein